MNCCGKHKSSQAGGLPDIERKILPTDECLLCAEKHFSTAYALASESGYEGPNRLSIIGQLCLAQWHCFRADPGLAGLMRDIRHLVQQRRETEIDWGPAATAMNLAAAAEAAKLMPAN